MTKSIRAIPLLLVIVLIVSITSVVSAQSGPASCANDGAVTDAANNPGLVSDCAGLLASRDTLSGSATLNWSADLAVEDWEGVTVGGSPRRVTRLILSRNELTGEIPGELGGLTNLEDLNLSGNQLTGEIPGELGGLTNLEDLNLSGNQLTGEIPAELGGLTNLERLYLYGNQLTEEIPGELGGLANLQTLWLSGNQLTGCIPQNLRRIETNDLSQLGLPFCDMPGAPTIATPIGPGDASLTVAWAVPINTGSSAITAYDLRYIETGAADKSDANWTVVEDVWAAGSGSLQYTLTGLTGGTQYDVQVRAVNAAGPGTWSATVTGTTASAVTDGDPLFAKYDTNNNRKIDRGEVITAINDYLDGAAGITRAGVIRLINLYLDG